MMISLPLYTRYHHNVWYLADKSIWAPRHCCTDATITLTDVSDHSEGWTEVLSFTLDDAGCFSFVGGTGSYPGGAPWGRCQLTIEDVVIIDAKSNDHHGKIWEFSTCGFTGCPYTYPDALDLNVQEFMATLTLENL